MDFFQLSISEGIMNMDICRRCGEKTSVTIMSMYNTQIICMKCKDEEAKRPDYRTAQKADERAVKSGNYNFNGVGLNPC